MTLELLLLQLCNIMARRTITVGPSPLQCRARSSWEGSRKHPCCSPTGFTSRRAVKGGTQRDAISHSGIIE